MPTEKSNRARMRRQRRRLLIDQLQLISEVLCESHNPKDRFVFDAAIDRAERIIYELKGRPKLNDEGRKRYAQAFFQSVADQATIVEVEENNDLHLDGFFDFDELYQRFVIIDPKPVLQEIGGDNGNT